MDGAWRDVTPDQVSPEGSWLFYGNEWRMVRPMPSAAPVPADPATRENPIASAGADSSTVTDQRAQPRTAAPGSQVRPLSVASRPSWSEKIKQPPVIAFAVIGLLVAGVLGVQALSAKDAKKPATQATKIAAPVTAAAPTTHVIDWEEDVLLTFEATGDGTHPECVSPFASDDYVTIYDESGKAVGSGPTTPDPTPKKVDAYGVLTCHYSAKITVDDGERYRAVEDVSPNNGLWTPGGKVNFGFTEKSTLEANGWQLP
jgi:hypothetical protein